MVKHMFRSFLNSAERGFHGAVLYDAFSHYPAKGVGHRNMVKWRMFLLAATFGKLALENGIEPVDADAKGMPHG